MFHDYYENYKKAADVPEGFGTLKNYREWRKGLSGLMEGIYPTNGGFTIWCPNEASQRKLFRKLGIGKTKLTYSVGTTVKYGKTSSRYGDYDPHSYLVIHAIRTVDNLTFRTVVHEEYLNYRSKPDIRNSKLWKEKTGKYFKATTETGGILWKGKLYLQSGVMKLKGITYHFEGKPTKKVYRNLLEKVKIREEKRAFSEVKRKKFGKVVTFSGLAEQFGWCELGMKDFCDTLGITSRKMRTKEIINFWRNASKDHRSKLKHEYAVEIAELLRYCRGIS